MRANETGIARGRNEITGPGKIINRSSAAIHKPIELYLDLLKRTLTRVAFLGEEVQDITPKDPMDRLIQRIALRRGYRVVRPAWSSERMDGEDWPRTAETMIGLRRLDNIQRCVEQVLADGVPGDLMETGVWRGGAVIFMRAVLAAYGVTDRYVWAADSFQGFPAPNGEKYPADRGFDLHQYPILSVGLGEVKANFARYGLLDDQVRFLAGWFADTLSAAPIDRLAVLRLDGDYYESTSQALISLEPKVVPGGFVIIDDHAVQACADAVRDYRAQKGITDAIQEIDWTGIYWRKGGATTI